MADQGCPYEGHDHRFNPWGVTCWLQRVTAFRGNPPLTVGIQWPPHIFVQGMAGFGWWWFARIGWRYDWNAQRYLLAAAFKWHQPEWTRF